MSGLIGMMAAVTEQSQSGPQSGTPLDYAGDLRLFLDAENDVFEDSAGLDPAEDTDDILRWDDQDTSAAFTIPGGGAAPVFRSNAQNSRPGVDFSEDPDTNGSLAQKLAAAASVVDNHFASGAATIAFACRWDKATDSRFNTRSTIASKGYDLSGGWKLDIDQFGTLRFQQRRSDNTTWLIQAPGFYAPNDVVLGTLTYDGGNTSGSGSFRLYDGVEFVTTGSVTTGTASGLGTDTDDQLVIGNIRDPNNADVNAPFEGTVLSLWFTRPGTSIFDEGYMARWIP
jgi:hypothetical protein